ncbi:hypothetical protein JHK87_005998 [Glycine soja]|nr:hypothetical protein JHK87_005998 [Glycine soja]
MIRDLKLELWHRLWQFIDVAYGQKLYNWRGETTECSFPSVISAICSTGSDKMQAGGISALPSFIAAGLSSGHYGTGNIRKQELFQASVALKVIYKMWSAENGVNKNGSPELHIMLAEYIISESPEVNFVASCIQDWKYQYSAFEV